MICFAMKRRLVFWNVMAAWVFGEPRKRHFQEIVVQNRSARAGFVIHLAMGLSCFRRYEIV